MANLQRIGRGGSLPPDHDPAEEAAIARSFGRAVAGLTSDTPIIEGVDLAIRLTLSPAEVQAIVGPGVAAQAERQRLCSEFVTDWLSPAIRLLGEHLSEKVKDAAYAAAVCKRCGGRLVGSEQEYGTCGDCGGRAVS